MFSIPNTTEENAVENMKALLADCKTTDLKFVRIPEHDFKDGRFAFLVWKDSRCHVIQMPGVLLTSVRFFLMGVPRIYIDDASFQWKFVVDLLDEKDMWSRF